MRKRRYQSNLPPSIYQRLRLAVSAAIKRCTDPGHRFWKNYGGRGIKVHKKWIDRPELFIEYLSTLEGHDDPELILDREDNNGDYKPGNLRFVTKLESNLNRRLNLRM